MQLILLVIHIIIAILLVGIILIQRTSNDGLSGLSGGSNTGVMSSRASANLLTRITAILAALFMVNSLVLANLAARSHKTVSVIDQVVPNQEKHKKHEHHPTKRKDVKAQDTIPLAQ
jgi:preprotein translocase subunit SecG